MVQKRTYWLRISGMLALIVLLLSSCGPTGTTSTNGPKKGGTVIDAIQQDPDTLLPMLTSDQYAMVVDQAIWAPLFVVDPNGDFYPGIAKEVPSASNGDISDDLKTFTIKLKSGLKWSDGSPETADDCVFSFNLYADPAFGNTFGFPTSDPKQPIATAVDPTTVKIVLKNPDVSFLSVLANGASTCISKVYYGHIQPADFRGSKENFQPGVTSGPFTISERVKGDHITLKRNGNFITPGLPYLDQVIFNIVTNQNTILAGMQNGSIDSSWSLDPTKLSLYKAIQGYTTTQDANPSGTELIAFNLQNPILSDVNVRKALTMSLNRKDIIAQVLNGVADLTCDDYSGTWAHDDPDLTCYPFDVGAANQLLVNAGWTMGSDGYRHKNGQTLELRYTTTNRPVRTLTQQIAQAAWKAIGIKIDIKSLSPSDFFGRPSGALCTGNFDLGEFTIGGGYDPDDHDFFETGQTCAGGGSNYMHYSNSTVDQLEKDQFASGDQANREAKFDDITTQVLKDVPVFYLYSAASLACHNNRLQNYNPSPLGATETWNIPCWWFDDPSAARPPQHVAAAQAALQIPATGCWGY